MRLGGEECRKEVYQPSGRYPVRSRDDGPPGNRAVLGIAPGLDLLHVTALVSVGSQHVEPFRVVAEEGRKQGEKETVGRQQASQRNRASDAMRAAAEKPMSVFLGGGNGT